MWAPICDKIKLYGEKTYEEEQQKRKDNMTAKEMFEKLGYKQEKDTNEFITYSDKGIIITFCKYTQSYSTKYLDYFTGDTTSYFVDVKDHLAITEQMKELGWI